jgi:hypothetical protein
MEILAYLFEGGKARQIRLQLPIGEISRLSTEADSNNAILDGGCSLHFALDSSPYAYGGQCAASFLGQVRNDAPLIPGELPLTS